MLRSGVLSFTLLVAAIVAASCTPSRAAAPPGDVPPGEVWLRSDEVLEAGILAVPVEERDVGDVLVAAGRISFNEGRISHLSSPVSGRVVRIDGALGEHVKKGQTLAVIRSPDLADATSALAKAEADLIATQHAFRRARELRAGGGASDAAVEQAEDAWRGARAEAERAQ
jgi:cobalt-zinc-cadmium efflux system membrane fusion protein